MKNYSYLYVILQHLGPNSAWMLMASAVLLYAPLMVMRSVLEGRQYQVAWSADFGGAGLVLLGAICCSVLLGQPSLPGWLVGDLFHISTIVLGIVIGVLWMVIDPPKQVADGYHHLVMFPLLWYLVIASCPVIFVAGTSFQKSAMWSILSVFAILFVVDCKTGRMDQRTWIEKHPLRPLF